MKPSERIIVSTEFIENLQKMLEDECSRRCKLEDKITKVIALIKDGRFVKALEVLEDEI